MRRWWLALLGAVGAVAATLGSAPWLASRLASAWVAAAIREAGIADPADPAAIVEVRVQFSWFATQRLELKLRRERGGERLAIAGNAVLSRGAWSLLSGAGTLPVEFDLEVEAIGPLAADLLATLRGDATPPPPPPGARPGGTQPTPPSRWQLLARGAISLRLLDETRGIDLAVRTDRLEFDASQGIGGAVDARIGRVAEWPQLPGRVSGEAAFAASLEAAPGVPELLSRGAAALEAGGIAIEWQGRGVELERGAISLRAEDGLLSIAARLSARVDQAPVEASADLKVRGISQWPSLAEIPLAAIGGEVAIMGLPSELAAAWLPAIAAEGLRDLGPTLAAAVSLPPGPRATALARVSLDHLEAEARLRLDRGIGSMAAESIELTASPSLSFLAAAAGRDGPQPALRVAIRAVAGAVSIGPGERWRAGSVAVDLREIAPLLKALAPVGTIVSGEHASLLVELSEVAGGGTLAELAAQGRSELHGAIGLAMGDGRPPVAVADAILEFFAEPLGDSLALRGGARVDGGSLRLEQRVAGLLRGGEAVPWWRLRPHGRIDLAGVSPSTVAAWLPQARDAIAALPLAPLSLSLLTRSEGDRLEGTLRLEGGAVQLESAVAIDSTQMRLGPASIEATLSQGFLEAVGAELGPRARLAGSLPLRVEVMEIALPPLQELAGAPLPPIAASLAVERMGIELDHAPESSVANEWRRVDLSSAVASARWRPQRGEIDLDGRVAAAAAGRSLGRLEWRGMLRSGDGEWGPSAVEASGELSLLDLDAEALPLAFPELDPRLAELLGGPSSLASRVSWQQGAGEALVQLGSPRTQLAARVSAEASDRGGEPDGGEGGISLGVSVESLRSVLPAAAVVRLLGDGSEGSVEPLAALRVEGAASGWRWSRRDGLELGELSATVGSLPWRVQGAGGPVEWTLPALSIGVAAAAARDTTAVRVASTSDESIRGDLRVRREAVADGGGGSWTLDGAVAAEGLPTALLAAAIDDGGLVEAALGESVSVSIGLASAGRDRGSVQAALRSPAGRLDLPQLRLLPGGAAVPRETPLSAELAFRPQLRRQLLARLNPIFSDIERSDGPIRLSLHATMLPFDGDLSRLDADLRLECGLVRIKPGAALSLPLSLAGDASAAGFDGLVEPLVATVRGGLLRYENFATRFVRSGDGWRQSLIFSGRIDLSKRPPYAEAITTSYPGANLAKFSSELRRLPPEVLDALSIPVTFHGPLGEGERLQYRIDLDVAELLRRGAEAAIPSLLDRLLRPR